MSEFKYRIKNNKLIIEECPDNILKIEYTDEIKTDEIKDDYDEVYLCEGIEKIDNGAFFSWKMKKIHLPLSLKYIEEYAFYDCDNLKRIVIPENVTYIGSETFAHCDNLEIINIPSKVVEIKDDLFKECKNLKRIRFGQGIETIGNNSFYNCQNLASIVLPNSVKVISDEAFACCSRLKKIVFSENIEKIGKQAFIDCESLKKVIVPVKVNELIDTFAGCVALKNVTLQEGLKVIDGAFNGCRKLKKIELPDSLEDIKSVSFCNTALESIVLPDNVKRIGMHAFASCEKLKEITFSENLSKIDELAFYGCSSLINVSLPNSLSYMGSRVFYECSSLEDVVLSNNIKVIQHSMFEDCISLKSVVIPEGIECIEYDVFRGCKNLKEVSLPSTLDILQNDAFYGVELDKIIVNCGGELKTIDFANKRFVNNSNSKLFLYDDKEQLYCLYNEGSYIEFSIDSLKINRSIAKLLNDKEITEQYFINLYYWSKKRFIPSKVVIMNMPLKDIDNFYLNNNGQEWAKLIKVSGNVYIVATDENRASFFKLCYVLGVFSESTSIRDKAIRFINENIVNELDGFTIHEKFDGFDLNNGFNEEYAEFFMKYYNKDDFMIYVDEDGDKIDLTCASYNNFNNVKKIYPSKTLHTNRVADILLPKHVMDAVRIVVYEDVDDGNEELAQIVGKYGYSEEQFETIQQWYNKSKSIDESQMRLFISKDIENSGITYKLLSKDDPMCAVLGNITNCCQVVDGVGESCVEYGMISNNSSFITFNYRDKIIGQAWVWYDQKSKTICLDNIEVPNRYSEEIRHNKQIQESFIRCLLRIERNFKDEMRRKGLYVEKVTIGEGYNDIRDLLSKRFKLIETPSTLSDYGGYSDAESQFEISKQNNMKKR